MILTSVQTTNLRFSRENTSGTSSGEQRRTAVCGGVQSTQQEGLICPAVANYTDWGVGRYPTLRTGSDPMKRRATTPSGAGGGGGGVVRGVGCVWGGESGPTLSPEETVLSLVRVPRKEPG